MTMCPRCHQRHGVFSPCPAAAPLCPFGRRWLQRRGSLETAVSRFRETSGNPDGMLRARLLAALD